MTDEGAEVMPLEEFQKAVYERWALPFSMLEDVLNVIESGVSLKRSHKDDAVRLVIDMLFVQAYKSLTSVKVLAEHGHMEDGATICRRLLELAIVARYIGGHDLPATRLDRAERYLAALWHELPQDAHAQMPEAARKFYEEIATRRQRSGAFPSFQAMFAEIGRSDTYNQDYSLLAGIAHGASFDQLVSFSHSSIPIRPIEHLGSVLAFSSRYALGVAMIWHNLFGLIEESELLRLTKVVTAWPLARQGAKT